MCIEKMRSLQDSHLYLYGESAELRFVTLRVTCPLKFYASSFLKIKNDFIMVGTEEGCKKSLPYFQRPASDYITVLFGDHAGSAASFSSVKGTKTEVIAAG